MPSHKSLAGGSTLLIKGMSVVLSKALSLPEAMDRHSYVHGTGIGQEMREKYPGGQWVTMNGRHVYVHNGRIVPETRPPGWTREHEIAAKNKVEKAAIEDKAYADTLAGQKAGGKVVAASAARAPGASVKTSPQRGWLIIPKKGNDTFPHRTSLGYGGFGGQWRGAGDDEGWHIPTVMGSKHAQSVLDYAKQNGLHGAFRPDNAAPRYKNESLDDYMNSDAGKEAAAKSGHPVDPNNHRVQMPGETTDEFVERRKRLLEADQKKGLRFNVVVLRVPGTNGVTYGVELKGYNHGDPAHRSLKNVVKKIATDAHVVTGGFHGGYWYIGSGEKVIDSLTKLRDKLGPMLEFNEVAQKVLAKNHPDFFQGVKAEADRSAAGLAAQAVEDPVKIKGLRATHATEGFKIKPHGYQWSGVHYLTSIQKGVLGFDTGLGKTLTGLMAAEHAKQNLGAKGPVKIIVPATRLYGWKDEIDGFFQGKKVVVIDGGPEERKRLYKEAKNADYVILSYATMTNEGAAVKQAIPGDIAIYDEAHYLKDPKSARSKAAYEYGSPKYTWWLTATPAENNLDETFRAMEFMNPGVFGEKKQFVKKFAMKRDTPTLTGNVTSQVVGIKPNERENFRKLIAPYFFMLDKENERVKIAMPPLSFSRDRLDMDPHQGALYNALRGDILANLDGLTEGKTEGAKLSKGESMHILTKILRLEQLSINPKLILPVADELGFRATNPALKAIAAKDYVAPKLREAAVRIMENWERTNSKSGGKGGKGTIVYAQSPETLTQLKEHLKQEYGFTEADFGIVTGATDKQERNDIQDRFNRGEHKVFLATKAANEGMNLQKNSNQHIDLDYEWNPSKMKQRIGRGYRQGQKEPFHHQQYAMRGSIEEAKIALINRKAALIGDMFDGEGDLKPGSLTIADLYELLGADPTKVARVKAASEAAVQDRENKRGARNARATAREQAAEAKAAAGEAATKPKRTRKPNVEETSGAAVGTPVTGVTGRKRMTAEERAERANSRYKPAQGYRPGFKVDERFMPGTGSATMTVRERPMFSEADLKAAKTKKGAK